MGVFNTIKETIKETKEKITAAPNLPILIPIIITAFRQKT